MYNIHLLPAEFGDSILIEYGSTGKKNYILIDGGPYYVFDELWAGMQRVAPGIKELELLVVTHIDIDHIDGIVKMLNQSDLPFTVKEIWFNGRDQLEKASALLASSDDLGSLQGEYLTKLITDKKMLHNNDFDHRIVCITDYNNLPEKTLDGGMVITLLSPGLKDLVNLIPVWDEELEGVNVEEKWEEDTRYADELGGEDHISELQEQEFKGDKSEANCSSIAFIASYKNKQCLFAADAPSHILLEAVNSILDKSSGDELTVDAWKLAHHGSKKSTQDSVMEKIRSKHILVSSNGKRYKHPDEPVIAKLLKHNTPGMTFHFNYKTAFNEMWDDDSLREKYNYQTVYPEKPDEPGITVSL